MLSFSLIRKKLKLIVVFFNIFFILSNFFFAIVVVELKLTVLFFNIFLILFNIFFVLLTRFSRFTFQENRE